MGRTVQTSPQHTPAEPAGARRRWRRRRAPPPRAACPRRPPHRLPAAGRVQSGSCVNRDRGRRVESTTNRGGTRSSEIPSFREGHAAARSQRGGGSQGAGRSHKTKTHRVHREDDRRLGVPRALIVGRVRRLDQHRHLGRRVLLAAAGAATHVDLLFLFAPSCLPPQRNRMKRETP